MNVNTNNIFVKNLMYWVQRYNPSKYWGMREIVVSLDSKYPTIVKLIYLYRIKRMDAFNNASMGTDLNGGACFSNPPILPHGLNGIVIHHKAKIGKDCIIYQQVTVAQNDRVEVAEIGDNCLIGAGAKIIGGVRIGNNVKIGANSVVVKDVPDNCTVVGVPAEVIRINGEKINTSKSLRAEKEKTV